MTIAPLFADKSAIFLSALLSCSRSPTIKQIHDSIQSAPMAGGAFLLPVCRSTIGLLRLDARKWTYETFFTVRSLCEYLNEQWYKFEQIEELIGRFPACTFITAEGRSMRRELWDRWMIQLIRYGGHPVLDFYSSRAHRRAYNKDRGWRLASGWEHKIDLLEQVIILSRDPSTFSKPWQAELVKRVEERRAKYQGEHDRVYTLFAERAAAGRCWSCETPIVPLMWDCPNCRADYEDLEGAVLRHLERRGQYR